MNTFFQNKVGYCRDCKHWKRGTETTFGPNFTTWTTAGKIASPKAGTTEYDPVTHWGTRLADHKSAGECRLASGNQQNNKSTSLAEAVCDGEGIYGELITSENFGCVLFEPGTAEEQIDRRRWD